MSKHRSQVLKEKMDKDPKFKRVRIAKNYDSISFNYRNTGRWMVVHNDRTDTTLVELWLNGQAIEPISTVKKGKSAPLSDVKSALDLVIDNDQRLYLQAQGGAR